MSVYNLLKYRWDPVMFHQANAIMFATSAYPTVAQSYPAAVYNSKSSIIQVWLEEITRQLSSYLTLPIYTMKESTLGHFFIQRQIRDTCNLVGYQTILNGNVTAVQFTKTNCNVPVVITIPTASKNTIKMPTGITATNTYGPDYNVWY